MPDSFYGSRDFGQYDANDEPILSDTFAIGGFFPVIKETVGQYIGVKGFIGEYNYKQTNEVKLFEGDIVEAWSEGSKGVFEIRMRLEAQPIWLLYPNFQDRKHWNIHGSDTDRAKGDYFDRLKVIGNIHEHPYLLEAVKS